MMEFANFVLGFSLGLAVPLIVIVYLLNKLTKQSARYLKFMERQYLSNCGFDPDECRECHLPGDCPLCGAK